MVTKTDGDGHHVEGRGNALAQDLAIEFQIGAQVMEAVHREALFAQDGGEKVDAAERLDDDGCPGDPGNAHGRHTETAIEKPGIENQVEEEARDQHLAEGLAVPVSQ